MRHLSFIFYKCMDFNKKVNVYMTTCIDLDEFENAMRQR